MAKKKLKKALMMAAPMLALAMMGRKGKAFTNADAIKKLTSNKAMRGTAIPMNANELAVDLMDSNLNTGDGLGILDMKKGGRVKRKTKKGGRAVRKANRSKKK